MGYFYYCPLQSGNEINGIPVIHGSDNIDAIDMWGSESRSPIYAIAGGVITDIVKSEYLETGNGKDYEYSTGNRVVYQITDECDLKDAYVCCMHLSPVNIIPWVQGIEVGTHIKKGDLLGYTGNTGHSYGFHLHIQIRYNSPWNDGTKIEWKPYTPQQGYRIGSETDKAGSWGYVAQLFRNIQPIYREQEESSAPPQPSDLDNSDIRWVCTMALLEATSLGLIGVQEVIGITYNRLLSPDFPNTIKEIISQSGQFTTYYDNKILFQNNGYNRDYINNQFPGLYEWAEQLFNGQISIKDGSKWAAGYDGRIARAYYFRSDKLIYNDYLYTRQNGNWHHYYNGINMWR